MALSFFGVLNVLVCLWEIALWKHIDLIAQQYKSLERRWGSDRAGAARELFMTPLSWLEALSFVFWTRIWSVYALFDPAYATMGSYGFFIDSGNGHSMLIPSLLWLVNSTALAPLSARWLGIVSLAAYYQMGYGTVLYFVSYFRSHCHFNKSVFEVIVFVGVSNAIWIFFPILGIWASIRLIFQDNFSCLL
jgi:hypothetical protein